MSPKEKRKSKLHVELEVKRFHVALQCRVYIVQSSVQTLGTWIRAAKIGGMNFKLMEREVVAN